jgi:hypothetical protein
MISIIICSRSKDFLSQVESNVAATIGVPYEVLAIDNSVEGRGICEVYNLGAAQAKYELLCFMHEDILFQTQDWGAIVVAALQPLTVGVVGVAGGTYQARAPMGWGGANQLFGVNIIHTTEGTSQPEYLNPFGKNTMPAATLDGVWLCCRKAVWSEFKFDAVAFPGFHFYDVDFSARVAKKYQNLVLFDVLIEHFSGGKFDKTWMQQALIFYKKRKDILPIATLGNSQTEKHLLDLIAFQSFTVRAIAAGLPASTILFCLLRCFKASPINRDNFYLAKNFLQSSLRG